MITPQLVNHLNLKATGFYINNSLEMNCSIYLYPNAFKGYKTYVMDCDPVDGKPLLNQVLFLILPPDRNIHPLLAVVPNEICLDIEALNHFVNMICDVVGVPRTH